MAPAPEGDALAPRDHGRARLLPLLAPVAIAGTAALGAAIWSFASASPALVVVAGVAALLAAATLAEAYPVPVESLPAGHVSLAAVFIVAAAVIYGWEAAAIAACSTRVVLELVQRRPLVRLVYNGSVYALSGAAAGGAAALVAADASVGALVAAVLLASAGFYVVNVVLVAAIIARWASEPFRGLLATSAYWTAVPFAIMASASLMLAVLWERSPVLSAALIGPLLAIALYQRSADRALRAMRLALTDALTGLGNQRHFHERLQHALDDAELAGTPLTLCVIDLDDLKRINDTHGHPVGDRVLEEVAAALRRGGEAFRVGGDEFALVLPGRSEQEGLEVADAVVRRLATIESAPGERISVSAGTATFPEHGSDRNELYRLADDALYLSKAEGKSRVRAARRAERDSAPVAITR